MTRLRFFRWTKFFPGHRLLLGLLLFFELPQVLRGQPAVGTVAVFDTYCRSVEVRLARQHRSPEGFVLPVPEESRLRRGDLVVEHLGPAGAEGLRGAMLHHWRGTAFVPGARAEDFELLMRDFRAYPQRFSPEVVRAGAIPESADRVQAWMRVRQHHIITVVMDTAYDVTFGRLDARHGYSLSRSTRIAEIDAAGTSAEHALGPAEEHGFLWRLNTYWSYEERDGGLYLQIETVSLTRSVPNGLGWAVRPYVESIPRESMEFTLRSARAAIAKTNTGGTR